ncbi:MAG: glycosyltransferase family 10 [Verrucomicrobiota bacterium]|jgi:hypothetical protein
MYLGFYSFYKHYNRNRMLDDPTGPIGDDIMYGFYFAGQRLRQLGHRVATLDMDDLEKFDAAIFFDHPTLLDPYFRKLRRMKGKKLYLFLFENPANRPDEYWRWNLRDFDKVFTWNPQMVDHKKFFQFWYSMRVPAPFQINRAEKTKFCVTIASQKYNPHPRELYTERVRAIRWFESHHPEDLDLYGQGWDRRYFTGGLARLNLLLLKIYPRFFPNSLRCRRFPSWKGAVPVKNAVMRQYRFALCYENAVFPGYVTEKIFDGFFAGCVPIYRGAPDVADFIPARAFIDMRNFKNYDELYRYLKAMPEQEYEACLAAIEDFVRGDRIRPFTGESFANVMLQQIIEPGKTA